MLNPSVRDIKAQSGRFLREKWISDHGLFPSYQGQQKAANGQDSCGVFAGMHRVLMTGYWLVRWLHQLKASTAMNLGISIFLISA